MSDADEQPAPATPSWRGRTPWSGGAGSLRSFLHNESGSAKVLVVAVVAALLWANIDQPSYERLWHTELAFRLGSVGMAYDLREWVNSGLMTLFFLVIGLEARREFDLGDLRERRRFVLPLATGLVAMVVPALIYLAVNHGGPGTAGWGVAMSTDTALALGILALVSQNGSERVRIFLVTVFVVDDLVALLVIALVYSDAISLLPLLVALAVFVLLLVAVRLRIQRWWVFAWLGLVIWAALMNSGVDPIVAGLLIGLSAPAYTPRRGELEGATVTVRAFREQPTPALARSATLGLNQSLSPMPAPRRSGIPGRATSSCRSSRWRTQESP